MFISTIIPFYNSERYIKEAIYSVLDQTYKDFEIICVNNNSLDKSVSIVNSLIEKFPDKIKLIEEFKVGANAARNKGLSEAKGDFIQFLDADDVIAPNKFESQIVGFEDEKISIVVSDRITKDESLKKTLQVHRFNEIENDLLNTMISKIIITGNPLYRKLFLEKIGGWDETLLNAQDWELNIRAVLRGANVKYIEGFFLYSRSVENSLSYNWINVSHTCTLIIKKYSNEIFLYSKKLSESSYRKMFYFFYINAIDRKSEEYESIVFIKNNIPNWNNYLSFAKKSLMKIIGFKGVLKLERLKTLQNKKSNR